METKPCLQCGKEIPADASFCSYCGCEIITCPECGVELLKTASVCGKCGMPIQKEDPEKTAALAAAKEAEEKRNEEQKLQQEQIKFTTTLCDFFKEDQKKFLRTKKKKITTILAFLFLGAMYYVSYYLEFNFKNFNFFSFLVVELVALFLFMIANDYFKDIIFMFIRTIKSSNYYKNIRYQNKTCNQPATFKSFMTTKRFGGTYYMENQDCMDSMIRGYLFLNDSKSKTLIFVQFFVGLFLGLADLILCVASMLFLAVMLMINIESGFKTGINFLNSSDSQILINILISYLVIQGVFSIFKTIMNKEIKKREEAMESAYNNVQ